jgi:hypothetical protein
METLIYIIGGIIIIFAVISLFLYLYLIHAGYQLKKKTEKFFENKVVEKTGKIIEKKLGKLK